MLKARLGFNSQQIKRNYRYLPCKARFPVKTYPLILRKSLFFAIKNIPRSRILKLRVWALNLGFATQDIGPSETFASTEARLDRYRGSTGQSRRRDSEPCQIQPRVVHVSP